MASIYGSQSGGKILRQRRTATARTPYDRPDRSGSTPRSPNWLSRFVLSPTRFVAGKLVSSVLDLQSSPTSSSSSSSSSSSGSDSDAEEIGTVNDDRDIPFEGDDALKKGLKPLIGNSKNKRVIEQLLLQEMFSREECDRLISIIRSRVVDSPAKDDGNKRPRNMPNRTLGSDTDSPDLSSAAVMEAKKWLQEKKLGLDSNSDLGYGSHSLNLVTSPQAFEDGGSPVDVAKSYMHARPPWACTSIDNTKAPSSPIGIQLFKEETSYRINGYPTSSSKLKRDSPCAAGSWSIQDEIRRVRSRATEQMLRTLPSSKIDCSALSMEYTNNVNSSAIEIIEASLGEIHNVTNAVDASSKLARGLITQASPDLERKQDRFQPEALVSDPSNINSEQNQGFEAVQQTIGSQDDCREITTLGQKHGLSDDMMNTMHRDCDLVKVNGTNDTNGANHQLNSVEETTEASISGVHDGNCLILNKMAGAENALANGFSSSGTGFHAGHVIEQNTKTLDIKPNTVDPGQHRTTKGALEQETCKLLSETSMEVPDVIVNDTVAINEDDCSQNSSAVQREVQRDYSQPGTESDLGAKPSSIAKQKGKRITRHNRRGRGRVVK